jgi:hypothetical protein
MAMADVDHDGLIDLHEFVQLGQVQAPTTRIRALALRSGTLDSSLERPVVPAYQMAFPTLAPRCSKRWKS